MKLNEYSDEEIVQEVKRRGIELTVHVTGVEVECKLGGVDIGDAICTERQQ